MFGHTGQRGQEMARMEDVLFRSGHSISGVGIDERRRRSPGCPSPDYYRNNGNPLSSSQRSMVETQQPEVSAFSYPHQQEFETASDNDTFASSDDTHIESVRAPSISSASESNRSFDGRNSDCEDFPSSTRSQPFLPPGAQGLDETGQRSEGRGAASLLVIGRVEEENREINTTPVNIGARSENRPETDGKVQCQYCPKRVTPRRGGLLKHIKYWCKEKPRSASEGQEEFPTAPPSCENKGSRRRRRRRKQQELDGRRGNKRQRRRGASTPPRQQASTDTPRAQEQRVRCPFCNVEKSARGMGRHAQACERKHNRELRFYPEDAEFISPQLFVPLHTLKRRNTTSAIIYWTSNGSNEGEPGMIAGEEDAVTLVGASFFLSRTVDEICSFTVNEKVLCLPVFELDEESTRITLGSLRELGRQEKASYPIPIGGGRILSLPFFATSKKPKLGEVKKAGIEEARRLAEDGLQKSNIFARVFFSNGMAKDLEKTPQGSTTVLEMGTAERHDYRLELRSLDDGSLQLMNGSCCKWSPFTGRIEIRATGLQTFDVILCPTSRVPLAMILPYYPPLESIHGGVQRQDDEERIQHTTSIAESDINGLRIDALNHQLVGLKAHVDKKMDDLKRDTDTGLKKITTTLVEEAKAELLKKMEDEEKKREKEEEADRLLRRELQRHKDRFDVAQRRLLYETSHGTLLSIRVATETVRSSLPSNQQGEGLESRANTVPIDCFEKLNTAAESIISSFQAVTEASKNEEECPRMDHPIEES